MGKPLFARTIKIVDIQKQALLNDLHQALADRQFFLVYQVQKSIASGKVLGHEALIRWHHPRLGTVMPKHFIALAEESGLIRDITLWVLREACWAAAQWPQPRRVAINVSAAFIDDELFIAVRDILEETGLDAACLELEVTESTALADHPESLAQLTRIHTLGVRIALDDFGAGYASIDTLLSFPFDRIKLDRHFVTEIEAEPGALALLRSVLTLGRSMGVPMLAEGVERAGQLEILRREGCDEVQGRLIGAPLDAVPAF